jgi:hypothetical protein
MSDPTLKVKNHSASDVKFKSLDEKEVTIPKATGAPLTPGEAALNRAALLSKGFRDAFKAGALEFAGAPASDEERALAVDVTRSLLSSIGLELVSVATSVKQGKTALSKQRDTYNASWTQVNALLTTGAGLKSGTKHLRAAATLFLTANAAEDALEAAKKKLEDEDVNFVTEIKKKPEDFDAKALAAYLEDTRKGLEKDVAAAEAQLAAAKASIEAEFAGVLKALDEAVVELEKPTNTIGVKLSWTLT